MGLACSRNIRSVALSCKGALLRICSAQRCAFAARCCCAQSKVLTCDGL